MRLFLYFLRCGFAARERPGACGAPLECFAVCVFSGRSRTESLKFRRSSTVGHTRSHSEHGSQATCRRWYLAFGPGRVGRRRIHGPPREIAGALLFFARLERAPSSMPARTFPCNPPAGGPLNHIPYGWGFTFLKLGMNFEIFVLFLKNEAD